MAITYVGSAGGLTDSFTMPTHQVGDMILVYAFRDGNATAPTLPGDFTQVISASGTSSSAIVGYKIADTTSETSGTWTNATSTIGMVYRGPGAIGASASSAGNSTIITYPALSGLQTDNKSWVVGFGGTRSADVAIDTAPSGLTFRVASSDATDEAAGFDSNGTLTSWTAQTANVGGSSGRWIGITVELREPDATWNPADKAATISLSNGNLTATKTGTTGYAIVRGTHGFTSGKYVFAINPDVIASANNGDFGVGIINGTTSLTTWLGSSLGGSAGYVGAGGVWIGGTQVDGTLSSWSASASEVMVAFDLDNDRIWYAVNGGNWNNNASANPATNTGGISISALTGTIFPAVQGNTANDAFTANFGASSFTKTVPSGFTSIRDAAFPPTVTVSGSQTVAMPTSTATAVVTANAILLNSADKAASITLSNGDLTATKSGATAYAAVRATTGKTTGKWAFWIDPVTIASSNAGDVCVGFMNGTVSLNTYVGSSLGGSVGYVGSSGIWFNGTQVGTAQTFSATDTEITCLVDLDNDLAWFRTGTGLWNGNSSANPTNGTGGVSISSITGTIFPAVSVYTANDAFTVNFGATAPANTFPSGFTSWDGTRTGTESGGAPSGFIWASQVTASYDRAVPVAWGDDPQAPGSQNGFGSWWVVSPRETWSYSSPDNNQINFEIRSGDHYDEPGFFTDPTTSERNEIGFNPELTFGSEIAYGFESKISGSTNTSPWCVLHQAYGAGVSASPPFSLVLESGAGTDAMRITTRSGSPGSPTEVYRWTQTNFPRDTWKTWWIEQKLNVSGSGSYLKVWLDGTQILNLSNIPFGYTGQTGTDLYFGVYRSEANETLVHSIRNMKVRQSVGGPPASTRIVSGAHTLSLPTSSATAVPKIIASASHVWNMEDLVTSGGAASSSVSALASQSVALPTSVATAVPIAQGSVAGQILTMPTTAFAVTTSVSASGSETIGLPDTVATAEAGAVTAQSAQTVALPQSSAVASVTASAAVASQSISMPSSTAQAAVETIVEASQTVALPTTVITASSTVAAVVASQTVGMPTSTATALVSAPNVRTVNGAHTVSMPSSSAAVAVSIEAGAAQTIDLPSSVAEAVSQVTAFLAQSLDMPSSTAVAESFVTAAVAEQQISLPTSLAEASVTATADSSQAVSMPESSAEAFAWPIGQITANASHMVEMPTSTATAASTVTAIVADQVIDMPETLALANVADPGQQLYVTGAQVLTLPVSSASASARVIAQATSQVSVPTSSASGIVWIMSGSPDVVVEFTSKVNDEQTETSIAEDISEWRKSA